MGRRTPSKQALYSRLVHEQRDWIRDHGGSLSGYIDRYGDPGMERCYGDGGTAIYAADMNSLHDYERQAGLR